MKDAFEEIDLKGYSEIPYDQLDVLLEHANSDIFVQSFLKNISDICNDDEINDGYFGCTLDFTILPPQPAGEYEYHEEHLALERQQPLYLPYKENEYKMYMTLFKWEGLVVMEYDKNCKDFYDYANKYANLRSKYTNEFIANENTVLERIEQLKEMEFYDTEELREEIEKQYEEHPKYIDVTGWDVSNIKNMSWLFAQYEDLEEIKGLNTWDVSNVENMSCMFADCPLENKYGEDGEKLIEQNIEQKQNKGMKM